MESFDNLVFDLKWGHPNQRRKAAIALGRIREDKCIPPLIQALKTDKDALVRIAAIQSLQWIADPKTIEVVNNLIGNEKDPIVKKTMAEYLGHFKNTSSVEPLIQALHNEDDESAQLEILEALGRIADERALKIILKYYQRSSSSGNDEFKKKLMERLEEIAVEHGYSSLSEFLDHAQKK